MTPEELKDVAADLQEAFARIRELEAEREQLLERIQLAEAAIRLMNVGRSGT